MRIRYGCVITAALITLAGCGIGGAGAEPAPTTMPEAEVLAIGKQIAQCFRDQGLAEMPDPIVDEHGQLVLPGNAEAEMEGRYPQATLERAQQACQSLIDRLPQSALGGGSPEQQDQDAPGPEDVDALRAYAACMRQNGYPDWPDPKSDGSFPLAGSAIEAEGKSPRLLQAWEACKQHWDRTIRFS